MKSQCCHAPVNTIVDNRIIDYIEYVENFADFSTQDCHWQCDKCKKVCTIEQENMETCDMTEKELMKIAGEHIAEACGFLFECKSQAGKIMAVQCDLMLKFIHILKYDDDILIAATSYEEFETEKYEEFLKKRRLKLVVNNTENKS